MTIDAQFTQAKTFATAGKLVEAEKQLNTILSTHPDHLPSIDLMGFVQYFLKRPDQAQSFCERALSLKPDHTYALKGLGMCLAAQGRVDEGVLYLKQAVEQAPNYFDAHWDLAVVLMRAKRNEVAREVINAAIEAVPAQRQRFERLMTKLS